MGIQCLQIKAEYMMPFTLLISYSKVVLTSRKAINSSERRQGGGAAAARIDLLQPPHLKEEK